jgi:excisionase family DNA binding protein
MPELRTIDAFALIFKIKPCTVRRLIREGTLPYLKAGRRYLFTDEHIKAFIARNEGNVKAGGNCEAPH